MKKFALLSIGLLLLILGSVLLIVIFSPEKEDPYFVGGNSGDKIFSASAIERNCRSDYGTSLSNFYSDYNDAGEVFCFESFCEAFTDSDGRWTAAYCCGANAVPDVCESKFREAGWSK